MSPTLKILYGVRYDVYGVPDADPNAPVENSQCRTAPMPLPSIAARCG